MKKILLISIIAVFSITGCTLFSSDTKESVIDSSEIIFALIGDNEGENPAYTQFLKMVSQDKDIDFVIHVGDLMNQGTKEEIQEILDLHTSYNLDIPFYVVPGNHDIKDDEYLAVFTNTFGDIPRSIDVEDTHFVFLDNAERKIGFTDADLNWLEKDLASVKDKMIFLVFHRPFGYPFADVLGDDETTTSRTSNKRFQSIISKHNISYIFNGHIHTYLEFPFVIKDDSGSIIKTIPALISGGGGQSPQNIFSTFLKDDFHYVKVTISNEKITTEKISLP